jgi:hypothetical protein
LRSVVTAEQRYDVSAGPLGVAGLSPKAKKMSEEVIKPVDSILSSVAVIAVLAFVCALLLADFHSDHYSA